MSDQFSTSPNEWEIDTLPNRLTVFRIFLIPIIVGSLYCVHAGWLADWHYKLGFIAGWTFVAASITDFLDGYIARKRGQVTIFGSLLDPVADKLLVVSSLVLLGSMGRIPVLLVIILVMRELYITSLRLLAKDKGVSVPVGTLGKYKTVSQMVGIPLLMGYARPWKIPMPEMGTFFIYLASFLSIYSALQYSLGLVKKLRAKRKQEHGQ